MRISDLSSDVCSSDLQQIHSLSGVFIMNAINNTKIQAINTAVQDPIAPAQPSQSMLLVPLSQLRASKRNVRKTKAAGQSIDALEFGRASCRERVCQSV